MIKRNLLANYVGQAWSAIMNFAFIPTYIKFLGIESYGLIGLFGILQAWLTLLDMGMAPTVSREMARFKGGEHTSIYIRTLLRSIEVISFIVAFIIFLGVYFFSDWLASNWLHAKNMPTAVVSKAFSVMGFVTAIRFIEGIYRSAIIGLQKHLLLNFVNIVFSTCRGIGAVLILSFFSSSIYNFFLWQGLISLITVLVLLIATYKSIPTCIEKVRFSFLSLDSIKEYAGGIVGITFLSLILTQVDKILLTRMISLEDFGYYSLATTVSSILFPLIGPVIQTWFPKLAELYAAKNYELLVIKFHQGAQLVSVLLGSAAVILFFFSSYILNLWTQDPVLSQKSSFLLSMSSIACLLSGLNYIPYNIQLAYGWTSLTMKINIISIFIIVPVIYFLAKNYGAAGAISASIILTFTQLFIGTQFMFNKILISERLKWYLEDIFIPLIIALIIAYPFTLVIANLSSKLIIFLWLLFAAFSVLIGTAFSCFHVRHTIYFFWRHIIKEKNNFLNRINRVN